MSQSSSNSTHLTAPLTTLRGVGPSLQKKLARLNLYTIEDLLYCLPIRYEDRRELSRISQLKTGSTSQFCGKIISADEVQIGQGRKKSFEMIVADASGQMLLKWFHYRRDWMKRRFQCGQNVLIVGTLRHFRGRCEILHPDIELVDSDTVPTDQLRILPVYPLTEGLGQNQMRKICQQAAMSYAELTVGAIPEYVTKRHQLIALGEALLRVHCPPQSCNLEQLQSGRDIARQTIVFDEFFYLQLGLALRRQGVRMEQGIAFEVSHTYTRPLVKKLPFKLTDAQRKVLREIKFDMMAPHPMNRLIQGDVGSGKTIVALLAGLIAVENNRQVALVAPTAILAEQHFQQFNYWLKQLGLNAALLTGACSKAERLQLLQQLGNGSIDILVGTHAVLQPDVVFHRLGLGIVDEQHRFGVEQRNELRKKGHNADILVMTATPIPRTLSMTAYGDLSISVIDQLPAGRIPIKTRVTDESKQTAVMDFIKREVAKGRQGYIVYPLVEESEKLELQAATNALDSLRQKLGGGCRLALLHGRLSSQEKEAVMQQFNQHQIDVLVATTVIEVGIDVANATMMIVEHAERFGLAQLHQLRGRVGRGTHQSYCVLVRSKTCSDEGLLRLQVMERSENGFEIAEADLAQRGAGELLGTKQAGLTEFRVANLLTDGALLEIARQEAMRMAQQDDLHSSRQFAAMMRTLKQRWGTRLELARVG